MLVGDYTDVSLYLNAPNEGYRWQFIPRENAGIILAEDIDSDGDVDILSRSRAGDLQVLRNDGSAKFRRERLFESNGGELRQAEDIDADGDLDLLVRDDSTSRFLLNVDGTFLAGASFDVVIAGLADLDGDDDLDFVTETGAIWKNDEGTFVESQPASQERIFTTTPFVDIDQDGDLDFFDTHFRTNDGLGNLSESQPNDESHSRSVFGDLDGDGDLDRFSPQHGSISWQVDYQSDIRTRIISADSSYLLGKSNSIQFEVEVANLGDEPFEDVWLGALFPQPLSNIRWTCTASGGASCSVAGTGNISEVIELPANSTLTYFVSATIPATANLPIELSASADIAGQDFDPFNDSAVFVIAPRQLDVAFNDSAAATTQYIVSAPQQGLLPTPQLPSAIAVHHAGRSSLATLGETSEQVLRFDTVVPAIAGQRIQTTIHGTTGQDGTVLKPVVIQDYVRASRGTGILVRDETTIDATLAPKTDDDCPPLGGGFARKGGTAACRLPEMHLVDVDSDNDLDIFLISPSEASELWLNEGQGAFVVADQVFDELDDVAFGDVDGDGDADAIAHWFGSRRILRNDEGIFRLAATLGSQVSHTVISDMADMDGDGDLDFITARDQTILELWKNDGSGRFDMTRTAFPQFAQKGLEIINMEVADADGDGDIDIVTKSGQQIRVHFNDGLGSLADWLLLEEEHIGKIRLIDVDSDGDPDIVSEHIWTNRGNSRFDRGRETPFGIVGHGDFDADGDWDLLNQHGQIVENNGTGRFEVEPNSVRSSIQSAAVGDLDLDGDLDAIAYDGESFDFRWNVETLSDISVAIAGPAEAAPGDPVRFEALITNDSDEDFRSVVVQSTHSESAVNISWSCTAKQGAVCSSKVGLGWINESVDLTAGSEISFELNTTASANASGWFETSFVAQLDNRFLDAIPANNTAAHSIVVHPFEVIPGVNSGGNSGSATIVANRKLADFDPESARLVVFGQMSGSRTMEHLDIELTASGIVATSRRPFHAGETVHVTAVASNDTAPMVWQFQVATTTRLPAFGESIDLPVEPYVFGDLDGDGDLDAIGRRVVLFNEGDLNYRASNAGDVEWLDQAKLFDVDLDGDLDVVDSRNVYRNDGSGLFTKDAEPYFSRTSEIAAGDLDGDGDLDVVSTRRGGTIWLNDGTGSFRSLESFGIRGEAQQVVIADFDSDGDLDVLLSFTNEPVTIWINDGHGGFQRKRSSVQGMPKQLGTTRVLVGDINGDHHVDLINHHEIWLNDGKGNFSQKPHSSTFWGLALGDIDGDNDLDLLGDEVWLNDGLGELSLLQAFDGAKGTASFHDFDGDGDMDVRIGNRIWPNLFARSDFNRDRHVNELDLQVLMANFGRVVPRGVDGDANQNGTVDFLDFIELANRYAWEARIN